MGEIPVRRIFALKDANFSGSVLSCWFVPAGNRWTPDRYPQCGSEFPWACRVRRIHSSCRCADFGYHLQDTTSPVDIEVTSLDFINEDTLLKQTVNLQ